MEGTSPTQRPAPRSPPARLPSISPTYILTAPHNIDETTSQPLDEASKSATVELTATSIQQPVALRLPVNVVDVNDEAVRSALTPVGIAALDTEVFEREWSAEKLALLVDRGNTDQLLTLLGQMDDRQIADTLSFHHLSYEMGRVKYLNDVSGAIQPGQLTGLMGAPDAGITLLLSLLAGRCPLRGKLTGDMLFNGAPITTATRRYVGYVVKDNPNLPALTVYETLFFSARLRVSGESAKLIRFRTLLWMKILGLSHTYTTRVGDAITRGISGGERRRLSYGCEMIAGQSLVLADLPTTGLDSTNAYQLMKELKFITQTGRGTLVSMVQPSPEMLDLLDVIMIMGKGSVIYRQAR
jgi:ABC-type multidrug transport system ATPase subunit